MLLINHWNEVVSFDPNCQYLAFEKGWDPLMPYIISESLEMGLYSIETNQRIKAPFVWDNIKITSIEIDKTQKGYKCGYYPESEVYKIEIIIYPYHYWEKSDYKTFPHKYYTHTFYVKNGLFFFVDSILRTINRIINDGCSIETINFDFLEKQCVCFNFKAANDQPRPRFELPSECSPKGFYRIIETMGIDVYKYGHGSRNGSCEWIEVEITLQTIDEYVIHTVYEIINNQWRWEHKHKINVENETKTTKFTFDIEANHDDTAYINYNKVPVDYAEKNRITKIVTEELMVSGIKMIDQESAILYYSKIH